MEPCRCLDGSATHVQFDAKPLGTDDLFAEISLLRCMDCGTWWLNYLLEYEHTSGSGRWFRGRLTPRMKPSAENAAALLAALDGYLAGGSYFGGKVHWRSGPILTTP